jgi:RNAse (barnase) inhibitor barstar
MARKPDTTWQMLDRAFQNFAGYIESKEDKYGLSLTDLLHVSNFKGGNASITEAAATLPEKLVHYSTLMRDISEKFPGRRLSELSNKQLDMLKDCCSSFIQLPLKTVTRIEGLGPSYASALLSAHFVDLVPILDRRVINGANKCAMARIEVSVTKQGQIKKIYKHYAHVIQAFYDQLKKEPDLTMRQLDRRWFIEQL